MSYRSVKWLHRFSPLTRLVLTLALIAAMLGLLPLPAASAQSATVEGLGCQQQNPGAPINISISNSVAAGNAIIVAVHVTSRSDAPTVSDAAGNSYSNILTHNDGVDYHRVFAAYNVDALSAGQNITVNWWFANVIEACAIEVSGLTTSPFDRSAASDGQSATPDSGSTPATTHADELLIGTFGWWEGGGGRSASAGSGFTEAIEGQQVMMEYRVVNSTGTYNAAASLDGSTYWIATVTTFELALPPEMDVQGNGNSIPNGDASPSTTDGTDFGNTPVTGGTVDHTFTIANSGLGDLNLTGTPRVQIGGTHAADFSVTAQPSTPVGAGGGTTTFTVRFDPSTPGLRSATITILNNDSDENPYEFSIQGTGTAPEMDVQGNGNSIPDGDASPSTTDDTDFGTASMAGGTVDHTFTIENTGPVALNLTGSPRVQIGGAHDTDFSVTAQPSTPVGAGGGTTTFTVRFDPSGSGLRSATVSIASDDPDEAPYDFVIQGTGLAPDLTLIKTVDDATPSPGQTVTYTLTFSNAGTSSATGVAITDAVPISVTNTSVLSAGVAITRVGGMRYAWNVADLAVGEGGVITITGVLSSDLRGGHCFTNTASITSTLDSNSANDRSSVMIAVSAPDLLLAKAASPEPVVAGRPMTYTLHVTNLGTLAAGDVTLTDTLPPSTTLETVRQTDDDLQDFDTGIHDNTRWNEPRDGDGWLQIEDTLFSTGVYTSHTFDASNVVSWTALSWRPRRPYWKPLPNDGEVEWGYAFGEADMTGNRLLLHLDEAAGATQFSDTSGQGNHGTCPATGEESCPPAGVEGRFNGALSFTGMSNQTVVITDTVDPERYAIELWVYPTVVTDTSFILRTDTPTDTAGSYFHLLGISGDRFLHAVHDGSVKSITSTTTVQADTWYHVVGTAESGGEIKLYVNGIEEGRLDQVGTLWADGDWYRLGSAYGPVGATSYFSGRLDEIAVYTRNLSSGEVLDHYLRGALRLSFDVRSCDDATCTGESFGGVYSEQDHAGLGYPSVTLSGVSDARYFQYRATLETDESSYSPELRSVSVGPDHYAVYADQGGCAATARAFACTLGSVAVGELVTVTAYADVHPSALSTLINTAVVTSSLDTYPANNSTVISSTVYSQADLRIFKYDDEYGYGGTDPVNPGSPMTYTLIVHNAGPSTAWDVTVTDTLPITATGMSVPDGWDPCQFTARAITCTLDSLPPNTWPRVVVTSTAPATVGFITNTAWITAANEISSTNNSGSEITLVEPLADLSVVKVASPDPVNPGQVLTFTVTVTNSGPSTAENLVVTDTLQAGFAANPVGGNWSCANASASVAVCTLPSLASGVSDSFQITTTAPLTGTVANWAFGASNTTDLTQENNLAYTYARVRPVADLSVSKVEKPDPVDAASPLTFTLTITNAGYVPIGAIERTYAITNASPIQIPYGGRAAPYPSAVYLSGVVGQIQDATLRLNDLSHTYPGDLEILIVGPSGESAVLMANAGGGTDVSGLSLTFNDAGVTMPSSGTLTSTLTYRPTSHGLTGDLADPAPDGPYGGSLSTFDSASPNGLWRLYVYDTFGSDGGTIAGGWSLHLTTVATDTVTLTDDLPSGLTGPSVAAGSSEWTCGIAGDTVTCEADTLPVEVPTTFTITATSPITGDLITNSASVTSTVADFWPDDNTTAITTTVVSIADLSIVKTADTGRVAIGAPLTYTLAVTNAGPSPVPTPITVTDALPDGLTDINVSGNGWTCALSTSSTLTCTASNLAVGSAPALIIGARAPITTGVVTNTARVTAAVSDPNLSNNSVALAVTVDEEPIAGLTAANDSPTALGNPTTLTASIAAGSNVSYEWSLGDGTGATLMGNPVAYTYGMTGTYTAVVTATNSRGTATATTLVEIIEWYGVYLPLVVRNYVSAPDLVVTKLVASSNAVTVTLQNTGDAPVEEEFWVDVYIDPNTPPTSVNQTWQHVGDQGLVWGITQDALPLAPDDVLTLTLSSPSYHPSQSEVAWPLTPGTPVYAQVDSANESTDYGAVLENHEIIDALYNNVMGPSASIAGIATIPVREEGGPRGKDHLPSRP